MDAKIAALATELAAITGEANLRRDDAVRLTDPGEYAANTGADLMVSPGSTAEVAAVVRACGAAGVSIVPQGGRTGLVGGGAATAAQVILSLGRMNRVETLDGVAGTAVVGAGATLASLQEAAGAQGLGPGIDLPSRGTATIGGMIATNAGGLEAHRHGVMRHRILGLEVVLADGRILNDLSQVLKVSAGYDLKHLFIGAEGTLGVVTRAVIRLVPLQPQGPVMMLSLPGGAAMLETMRIARQTGRLRASEAMWKGFFDFGIADKGWSAPDYDLDAPLHFILEFEGGEGADDAAGEVFEAVIDQFPDATGVLAQSLAQAEAIWALREDTQAIFRAYPAAPSFDVSMPISELPDYAARTEAALSALGLTPMTFGHVGDGNLHIIIREAGATLDASRMQEIERIVMAGLVARGGSFSAEHGVGTKRRHLLDAEADPVKLALMAQIKTLLDPQNLMNPGKVIDPT
ncbi:FAD-binding oxidoreductase [Paracoccus aminophilus]|uniref:FAD linked oxidase domain-containing protein n=1 Tax=Paracoccus aminophilus JCM 7686 TaxID=1367847 RepID=S5XSS9_PARAH|nr:FAD-binding oxidoreductase [Paracoccus aminophilus]AGT10504.1 FAD linked oxidase domain-containing protein [Paracoccus aminophilus JCM 7686]